jgi:uncharacterized protein involved in exopolysaccharide biosynthesis/Mrp family chromosome partitioning ATPase
MNLPDNYGGDRAPLHLGSGAAVQFAAAPHSDRIDLRSIVAMFRRRLTMFVSIVAGCMLIALLISLQLSKWYSSEADVVVHAEDQVTPTGEGQPSPLATPPSPSVIATEQQLISSRQLAETVFEDLRLGQDADFMLEADSQGGLGGLVRWIRGSPDDADPAMRRRRAIDALMANLQASQIGTSNALRIVYEDRNAARSALIANGFASAYSAAQANAKAVENRRAVTILRARMDALRKQAQADYAAAQSYRITNNLLSTTGTSLTEQEISTYNQQVAVARAEAAQDQAALSAARAQLARGVDMVGEATASPVVQSLRSQRAAVSAKVADLSDRYLDTHPDLISARQQLTDIDAQIAAEVGRTLRALEAKAQASQERLSSLIGSLGHARGTLAVNNSALVGLDDLDRRAQASQALYASYLDRYKATVALSGAEQPNARIISLAEVPLRPSSPKLPLNLALGLLIGLVLGAAAALASENAYNGLTTGDDVERRIGVRFLGAVPLSHSIEQHEATPLATVANHPGGAFAEALRNVLGSTRQAPNGRRQVIAVTSAMPAEGKTTLAACLARVTAMGGEKVIVIDCDIVRGRLSRIFAANPARPGLRQVLREGRPFSEALVPDPVSGAHGLPITTPFAEGDRLLEKGALHRLIAKLREDYELILLDCSPLLPIAETRELVALADNVIVAASWRKTPDYAIRSAIKLMPLHAIVDVGVALTRVDIRKLGRFGYGNSPFLYDEYQSYYDQSWGGGDKPIQLPG